MPAGLRLPLALGASRSRVLLRRLYPPLLSLLGCGSALLGLLGGGRPLLGLLGGGSTLLGLLGGGGTLLGLLGGGGTLLSLLGGGRTLLSLLGGGTLLSLLGGGSTLLSLLGGGSLLTGGSFGGGTLLGAMVRRRWRSRPGSHNRRGMGGRRHRGRPGSRMRRLMVGLRGRDVLLRCCWRRLCRVRRRLRLVLRRLGCRMRSDPRRGQMREIRRTRRMARHGCRRGRIGGGGRCRFWRCRRRASAVRGR